MGENTKIEWTATVLPDGTRLPGMTFNPWHGCVKVSAGCKFCYADAQDRRFGESHWGPGAERKLMSDAYWRQPLRWNADAEAAGIRRKVFCASMADVFERLPLEHPSAGAVEQARGKLWALIEKTPHLDWLLLTKRPENIVSIAPSHWMFAGFPENVWVGTSVEDQAAASARIPHLLRVPAVVRFLSCEPLLGPVDLRAVKTRTWIGDCTIDALAGTHAHFPGITGTKRGVQWVICGGESGPNARPMHPVWARGLRDQCRAAGVPFFFKQWGEYSPAYDGTRPYTNVLSGIAMDAPTSMYRVGKHAAGRMLYRREWDEMPTAVQHKMPTVAQGKMLGSPAQEVEGV